MALTKSIPVPPSSLLAEFGDARSHRDCFERVVSSSVSLEQFIECFYSSRTFSLERIALSFIERGASTEDARRLASGEVESFAAWKVIERRGNEILLQDVSGATASWLAVEPVDDGSGATRLLFGSWVGNPDSAIVKALMPFHRWYSQALLKAA